MEISIGSILKEAKKLLLENLDLALPFALFFIIADSTYYLSNNFLAGSVGEKQGLMYLYSAILLIGQLVISFFLYSRFINRDGGKLSFSDFPYFIWANIKLTVLILAGAICLVLPAFGVLLFCFMGPLISIADEKCDSPFKESFRIVKENASIILPISFIFVFLSILDEMGSLYFTSNSMILGILASIFFSTILVYYYCIVYTLYKTFKMPINIDIKDS